MRAFVMDAFSSRVFGGNQAGVVLPDRPLDDTLMRQIAAEFKHSETAFVSLEEDKTVRIKYFTPAGEVDLCGHATIASFALLRALDMVGDGSHVARTRSGDLRIDVEGDTVWMDMAPPKLLRKLDDGECAELLRAYGLALDAMPDGFTPEIISTGLADIMLPVRDHATLMAAVQDERAVTALSRCYDCVGVHMFCPGDGACTAYCSNFAPLYDIPEECATGTSNGALTYYLYRRGLIKSGEENIFLQGEHMGRPSEIRSRLTVAGDGVLIRVGGRAVMSLRCELMI
ncbi:MAG: PhzF family phenazine biosynthesis protein [Oscillospiraceae bacterium]|nr:PhzF family phenazine biosynthesis protein [Oscillospiraceae bacterium]